MGRAVGGDRDDEGPGDEESRGAETEYHPESGDAGEFACPACGALIYGDAVRCPRCGEYVTPGARPAGRLPGWLWLGLALVLAAFAAGLVAGLVRILF